MFDTFQYRSGDSIHRHTTTITEKRAPTDDSVRLLQEMESAMVKTFLGKLDLKNNLVDVVLFKDVSSYEPSIKIAISINGKRSMLTTKVSSFIEAQENILSIHKQISEHIARELIDESSHEVVAMLRPR